MKVKAPRQTVCNIPVDNPKEPYCGGKLKRITELDPEAKKAAGADKDVRESWCEREKPSPQPLTLDTAILEQLSSRLVTR